MQIQSILLVEDSEDDVYFFTRSFQRSGLPGNLHHVLDGAAAIQFLSKASHSHSLPQIIFLDLKMPVLNGFDVLDWIRNQPFSSEIAVFVLSGSELQPDKDRAAQLGAAGYLVKPINLADLNRVIGGGGQGRTKLADMQTGARS
jgi:CheY-like chemotaxis protein